MQLICSARTVGKVAQKRKRKILSGIMAAAVTVAASCPCWWWPQEILGRSKELGRKKHNEETPPCGGKELLQRKESLCSRGRTTSRQICSAGQLEPSASAEGQPSAGEEGLHSALDTACMNYTRFPV